MVPVSFNLVNQTCEMNKKLIVKTITALLIAHFMVGNIWAHDSIKD